MQPNTRQLHENLKKYKRKFYINKLIKGIIYFVGILLSAFILVSTLEYFGYLNSTIRASIFFGFIILAIINAYWWIIQPIVILYNNKKRLSDEEAARQIGFFFPEIKDRLLNTIQLEKLSSSDNSLINASIEQRTKNLANYPFENAINYKDNRKYLKYAAAPVIIFLGLLLLIPQLFSESTKRIINYDQKFEPKAPFSFNLQNTDLKAFKNENFTINLKLDGKIMPENTYINIKGRKLKMNKESKDEYKYTLKNLEENLSFSFSAAGYNSNQYNLKVLRRPQLSSFNVSLNYPDYLDKDNKTLNNVGNLTIPEGTKVTWLFDTEVAESLSLSFKDRQNMKKAKKTENQLFKFKKQIFNSQNYYIRLQNKHATNKNDITYSISVIPDEYPEISLENIGDTSLYNDILLAGNISDDYGFTGLQLSYKINDQDKYKNKAINYNPNQNSQSFLYRWNLDSLNLKPGQSIEYYITVWDNDALNNFKAARTKKQYFSVPTDEEIEKEIEKKSKKTQENISHSLKNARKLTKEMKNLEDKLKTKDQLEWEDKRAIKKMMEKHKKLQEKVKQFQKQNQSLNQKRERFTKQNKELREKSRQLQKMMNEVMDEKTKKLFKELQKMLDEKAKDEEIQEKFEQMQEENKDMNKKLDRAMELFKQLKYDKKLSNLIHEVDTLAKQQQKLAEKSPDKEKGKDNKKPDNKNKDKKQKGSNSEKEKNNKKEDTKPGKKDNKTERNKSGNKEKTSPESQTDNNNQKDNEKTKDQEKSKSEIEKQKEIKEKFDNAKKDLKELKEINESLQFEREMQNTESEEKSIEKSLQKSLEQLQKNQEQKARESQQNTSEQMKNLSKKLQQMQQQQQKKRLKVDIKKLRNILDNILKLSFEQEELMEKFKDINQSNPQYTKLSQRQLQIQNDAEIIKDSLHALSKRIFQIKSVVNKEIKNLDKYLNESTEAIKERKPYKAAGKQQYVMTSLNNLSLLLNDILQQLQKQMANQMKGGAKMCNSPKKKPGNKNGQAPSLSQLQKELQKKLKQLKNGNKKGSELSKELAKMARQQAKIRRMLQKQMENNKQDKGKGGKGKGDKLSKMMKENEEDMVNKKINEETIERQKKIMTRLLEHEKGKKKQQTDNERKAQRPEEKQEKKFPPSFEKYLKQKEKQVELLKTISPNLTPFYKKEVNEYFKTIK